MLSVSRLLNGTIGPDDALRYGRQTSKSPAHLLHFSEDKKPVVVWNVTQRCNLHCAHCYASSHNKEYPGELTTQEGLNLLEDLSSFGVPTVLFSGGEPMTRPDLLQLAAQADSLGMRTVLSTNGTLITERDAEQIAEAGFSYVGISLDGLGKKHDKLRGSVGAFEGAVGGIKACQRAGIRTGIRFTVHGLNRDQMGGVFDQAEELGVNRLCVYHLAYAGRGEKISKYDLRPAGTREVVEEIFDRVEDFQRRGVDIEVLTVGNPTDGVLLYERVQREQPERAADVLQMLQWNGGNQSGIAVACVDPKGNIHPDQFSWEITAGNVKERPFSEVWADPSNEILAPYRANPREIMGRCEECAWLDVCNGGLRIRAISAGESGDGADPACYLTEEEIGAARETA